MCVPDPEVLPSYSKSNLHISGTMEELVKNAVSIVFIHNINETRVVIKFKKKINNFLKFSALVEFSHICEKYIGMSC